MEILDLLTLNNIFRVLTFVVLFGYCIYAFLLMLRVRILAQTLETAQSSFIGFLSWLHFVSACGGSILIGLLILF